MRKALIAQVQFIISSRYCHVNPLSMILIVFLDPVSSSISIPTGTTNETLC